jgi:hypothetical protein
VSKRSNRRIEEIKNVAFLSWNILLYEPNWRREFRNIPGLGNLFWHEVPYSPKSLRRLNSRSGLYTFIICPHFGRHKDHSYFIYVGKTNNIKRRFKEYLTEAIDEEEGRLLLIKALIPYQRFIKFKFAYVDEPNLSEYEKAFIRSVQPPCNIKDRGIVANLMQAQPAF